MTDLPESSIYEPGIIQLEVSDPVIGGVSGKANAQAILLANRTKYLKNALDDLVVASCVSLHEYILDYTDVIGIPGRETVLSNIITIPAGSYMSRVWVITDIHWRDATDAQDGYINFGTVGPNYNDKIPIGSFTSTESPTNMNRTDYGTVPPKYPISMTVDSYYSAYFACSGPIYYGFSDFIQGRSRLLYELTNLLPR